MSLNRSSGSWPNVPRKERSRLEIQLPATLLILREARLRDAPGGIHEAGHHLFRDVARSLAVRLREATRAVELAS
jgi:hypothetical protein